MLARNVTIANNRWNWFDKIVFDEKCDDCTKTPQRTYFILSCYSRVCICVCVCGDESSSDFARQICGSLMGTIGILLCVYVSLITLLRKWLALLLLFFVLHRRIFHGLFELAWACASFCFFFRFAKYNNYFYLSPTHIANDGDNDCCCCGWSDFQWKTVFMPWISEWTKYLQNTQNTNNNENSHYDGEKQTVLTFYQRNGINGKDNQAN